MFTFYKNYNNKKILFHLKFKIINLATIKNI